MSRQAIGRARLKDPWRLTRAGPGSRPDPASTSSNPGGRQPVKAGTITSSSVVVVVGSTTVVVGPGVVVDEVGTVELLEVDELVVDEVGTVVLLVVDDVEELVVLLDGGGPVCTSKAPMSAVPLETRAYGVPR